MNRTKNTFLVAFALFSLFFGAGNLILPPLLGFRSGMLWWAVSLGFCVSAVLIPILGIWAHAKLQGTMFDFAKTVSPSFSLAYCYLVYAISISLPSPRTAAVTHEMAIAPFFELPAIVTSITYFALVFLFVMNRSRILDIVGKILTPAIILILVAIIGTALFNFDFGFGENQFPSPFSHGLLEGYQTFDAIGAVVVGGVIIISINLKNNSASYPEKKKLIAQAGSLAGLGLFLIYTGLIITGALFHDGFDLKISRTALLNGISLRTLGSTANMLLSLLVALACFTTAVGIVAGTADFVSGRFNNSKRAYLSTAVIGCIIGILVGQFNVGYIIAVALPALMFIYPITIILILLNVLPEKYTAPKVFRWVIAVTILFSIPDFWETMVLIQEYSTSKFWNYIEVVQNTFPIHKLKPLIPLSKFHLGWVLPSSVAFIVLNSLQAWKNRA
ncbi:MAG: branched-chain amino acid transport system II carrier protein [Bacteroidota bacterium]